MDNGMIQNDNVMSKNKKGIFSKIFGGIGVALLMLIAYYAVQVVVGVVYMAIKMVSFLSQMDIANIDQTELQEQAMGLLSNSEFLTNFTAVSTLASAVVAIIWYFFVHGKNKSAEDKEYFKNKVLNIRNIITVTLATMGTYYIAIGISELINIITPSTIDNYNDMMNMVFGGNMFVAFVAIVILAPFGEECLFRGLIIKRLGKYFGITAAIIIQSILFGIFHGNIVQGLYVIPMGILLGYVSYKSKSVIPAIYMHLVNNFLSLALSGLPVWGHIVLACIVVVYLYWTLVVLKKKEQIG